MRPSTAMRLVYRATIVAEALTAIALILAPAGVVWLLLGAAATDLGIQLARFAGIVLLALSIACWLDEPWPGLVAYSAGVAILLAWLGMTGAAIGMLLWPAVVIHGVLTPILLFVGRSKH